MPLTIVAERAPLSTHEQGVVLVSGTRVPIETIVDDFNAGAGAEEIALCYPSLELGDVYAVIACYLRHKIEVDTYIQEQERLAAKARERHGVDETSRYLREKLLSRGRNP